MKKRLGNPTSLLGQRFWCQKLMFFPIKFCLNVQILGTNSTLILHLKALLVKTKLDAIFEAHDAYTNINSGMKPMLFLQSYNEISGVH